MNINIHEFLKKFNEEYDFLYNAKGEVAGASEATKEFDLMCSASKNFSDFVCEFVKFRGDLIASDREAAAFMFALTHFEEVI